MNRDNHTDIVLLTALRLEQDAILKYLGPVEESRAEGRVYHRGKVGQYDVVVYCTLGMGNVLAAKMATEAIGIWNPAHIILTGIAGGVKKKSERYLGDVFVADQIVDYELGKAMADKVVRRYQAYRPAKPLLDAAKLLLPAAWATSVEAKRPDGTSGRVVPQAHFGTVASGQKVITDPCLVQELQEDWTELLGVEMEGAGIALAAYENAASPGFLVVKGISDWADPEKEDGWQQYAAEAAAAFTVAILKSNPFESTDRQQALPADRPNTFSGKAKVAICHRLIDDWQELADYFDIPKHQRAKFERGREPAGVWEWLESRGKLAFLPEGLEAIQRIDLLGELASDPW